MHNLNLKSRKKYKQGTVEINVFVMLFEEDNIWYAYLPAFDLTGYGKNEEQAKESLTVVLDEFTRYTLNKNTFFEELKRLGWKIRNKTKPLVAPNMSDLINQNEDLKHIIDTKQISTIRYPVNIPAYA